MHIVAPALKDDITISTSSIYRPWKPVRKFVAQTNREQFVPNTPLIAHFDRKLLLDTDGDLVDRIPIVISGLNVEKLLANPKLSVRTSQLMGKNVIQTLQD